MPRTSLAEELYEDEVDGDSSEGRWLAVYDFHSRANSRFWLNLHRLSSLHGGSRLLQLSVYLAGTRRVARVAIKLARKARGAAREPLLTQLRANPTSG